MPIVNDPAYKIPDEVLIPIARKAQKEYKTTPVRWTDYETQLIREECGLEYHGIPIENVRDACENLRKAGKIGTIHGHGPSKSAPPNDELQAYYKTEWWKKFSNIVKQFWGYRCADCNSPDSLEVHHRTYERLGHEWLTDCTCLCRPCHKGAQIRWRRQAASGKNPGLF